MAITAGSRPVKLPKVTVGSAAAFWACAGLDVAVVVGAECLPKLIAYAAPALIAAVSAAALARIARGRRCGGRA
jgi:hypothetical protein